MTLLWDQAIAGTHYSVRQSGASIRLYSNRVFHSQWNPNKPFAGGVWDCLSLPVMYRQPDNVQRVLVLGVGGGAVIRQLQHLLGEHQLTGVELDACHLDIAQRWFGIDGTIVNLVHGDALQWLANYTGEPFDLIIDDLFGHGEGEPIRACPLTPEWVALLNHHLDENGLLIVNCVDARELKNSLPVFACTDFRFGYRWTLPAYENAIGVFSASTIRARDWIHHLANSQLSKSSQRQARLTVRRPLRDFGAYLKL